MHRIATIVFVSVFATALPAAAGICEAPELPDMRMDGSQMTLEQHHDLTLSVSAYDQKKAAYVSCINDVIFGALDATSSEIETARAQREGLYIKDPATGEWTDPVTAQYDAITAGFMTARAERAAQAALEQTRKSETQLASQIAEFNSDGQQ